MVVDIIVQYNSIDSGNTQMNSLKGFCVGCRPTCVSEWRVGGHLPRGPGCWAKTMLLCLLLLSDNYYCYYDTTIETTTRYMITCCNTCTVVFVFDSLLLGRRRGDDSRSHKYLSTGDRLLFP